MMGIEQTGAVGARLVGAAGPKLSASDLAPYLRHLASRDPGLLCLLADGMRRHSAADMLETIAVPTLILAGGRDPFCPPRLQTELHRRVRGSEIRWFDDAGHTLPLEEPDAVAGAVTAFLDANTD
jgi:pimeloyl-ACP methyl ester carboxylesterase